MQTVTQLARWAIPALYGVLLIACESNSNSGGEPAISGEPVELSMAAIEAARLLTQATYGTTEAGIQSVLALGDYGGWIDAQMAMPASLQLPYVKNNSNGSNSLARHHIWWINAIEAEDQLRQRVAFALSQIFVVSDLDYTLSNSQYSIANYYDMLAQHAFGNYRDLLEAVSLHPAMGIYLSMVRNEKENPEFNVRPDENYAREVLQLFSVGLFQLDDSGQPVPAANPEPAYSQKHVEEFARVFTGWNFDNTDEWQSTDLTPYDKESAMVPVEEFHDTGQKELLNENTVQAGLDTRTDLENALDNIVAHANVGPFFSRLLIQRLVTSNPTTDYVRRVASIFNDNGDGVKGDLGAVVKAILLDEEARSGHLTSAEFGKLKEPLLRLTQMFRGLSATPGKRADGVYHASSKTADQVGQVYGQAVLSSPSVFNFYLPDNPVPSRATNAAGIGLVSPEAQILTEANVASSNNDMHDLVYGNHNRADADRQAARINIERPLLLVKQGPGLLVDFLDLVLLNGHMSELLRELLLEHMNELAGQNTTAEPYGPDGQNTGTDPAADGEDTIPVVDDETVLVQVLDSIYLVIASPEYMVQR